MLKLSENPPVTWPENVPLANFAGRWWVAHTKSRNEKALAHDLVGRQISYFLPMSWKMRRRAGRKIRSLLPVFSGYLFFSGDENQRVDVLRTNRVAGIIAVEDQDRLVRELSQIEKAVRTGAPLLPHRYLKAGRLVRVTAGPMADLEGIVVRSKNATRLVLQVDILGEATSVEVDADIIEPID
jgi:transcriptional antiterminator RfaH